MASPTNDLAGLNDTVDAPVGGLQISHYLFDGLPKHVGWLVQDF